MLADSYYCGYFLIAELQSRGVDVLFEQHGARHTDFRTGEKLGARDHVVTWSKPVARPAWMTPDEYAAYPCELTLRELKVGKKVLVTSFLNPREVCRRELGQLFLRRWNVELDLRNIKSTLGMERLTCRTPALCEKEIWVYALAYESDSYADGNGRRTGRCAAAAAELQAYGSSVGGVESKAISLNGSGGHGRLVPADRPHPSRESAWSEGTSARQDATQTLWTPADNASQSTREHQEIWASEETRGLN